MSARTPWTPAETRFLAAMADHGDIVMSVRELDPFWSPTDEEFESLNHAAFGPVLSVLIDGRNDDAASRFLAAWEAATARGELSGMRVMVNVTDPDAAPASPEPPRGAAPSGTDGTPPPAVPAAPRGTLIDLPDPDHRPAKPGNPGWWEAEREASAARMGGATLIVLAAAAAAIVAAFLLAVTR